MALTNLRGAALGWIEPVTDLAKRVEETRKAKALTRQQVYRSTGITACTYQRMLMGLPLSEVNHIKIKAWLDGQPTPHFSNSDLKTIRKCWQCGGSPHITKGHDYRCFECKQKALREWRSKNAERVRSYWLKKDHAAVYRLNFAKNPEKIRARKKVANAIKSGRLTRQPCAMCAEPKAQAHHPDYLRPLEVEWLCHGCHIRHHMEARNESARD